MSDKPDSFVIGDIRFKGCLDALGAMLAAAGLPNAVGPYALRLDDFPTSFAIGWVGNIDPEVPYQVDACGYGVPHETVALWCARLAAVLQRHGIAHEFAHCDGEQEELALYASLQGDQAGRDCGSPGPGAG